MSNAVTAAKSATALVVFIAIIVGIVGGLSWLFVNDYNITGSVATVISVWLLAFWIFL